MKYINGRQLFMVVRVFAHGEKLNNPHHRGGINNNRLI